MPIAAPGAFNGLSQSVSIPVYADIAAGDTLSPGMYVVWKSTSSTAKERYSYVQKGTALTIKDIAGVVAVGGGRTGPGVIHIEPWDGAIVRGAQVYTDESITAGDLLAPIPNSYVFGKAVMSTPIFRATETVDRSTTNGLVTGDFGRGLIDPTDGAMVEFYDEFMGDKTVGTSADASTWLLAGTSAAAAFVDSVAGEGTAAAQAKGALAVTTNTTNQANLTLNGEPFSCASGKNLYFSCRAHISSIASGFKLAMGVGITDTTFTAGHSDGIHMLVNAGALTCLYQKGASGEVTVTPSPAITVAASEYHDFGFLVRNKGTGGKEIQFFYDGVAISHTLTATEVPDDQALTIILETIAGSASVATFDRVVCRNR